MNKVDPGNVGPQCNPATRLDCETAEILLRYASFATAGLPAQDVNRAVAILARRRDCTTPIGDE